MLSNTVSLKYVFHIPKLICNLLSVSNLSKDSNCLVIFFESHCEFQEQSSEKMIGSAKMIEGLYFDNDISSNKTARELTATSSSLLENKLCHGILD